MRALKKIIMRKILITIKYIIDMEKINYRDKKRRTPGRRPLYIGIRTKNEDYLNIMHHIII